ncbi:hypothetical protein [Pararhizobium sp. PWRC1-1]|uniref:hypothetical protein n=1 Tax=Pararhizobium sp. PWRC1-1 TaxID=2804566 RepID=UPI003CF842B4
MADEIAKALTGTGDGSAAGMAAGRAAIRRLAEMIATKTSFTYETTLSSQQSINLNFNAAKCCILCRRWKHYS